MRGTAALPPPTICCIQLTAFRRDAVKNGSPVIRFGTSLRHFSFSVFSSLLKTSALFLHLAVAHSPLLSRPRRAYRSFPSPHLNYANISYSASLQEDHDGARAVRGICSRKPGRSHAKLRSKRSSSSPCYTASARPETRGCPVLLRPRDDLVPEQPEHSQNSASVAGAIVGVILVGLALIALVMTVFWKCRVARWKRLEARYGYGYGYGSYEGDSMLAPINAGGKQKPLPTVPDSQILSAVPSVHDAGPEREASQPVANHYYA
ncbi:uncharacterized protein PG986_002766 [Apiospora aurea]|uniref:Uncharacterized protein n=1 Tax=Apiospora aurea TaxID=335848 RepID=A0ABR1QPR8_9PEZI